MTHNYHIDGMSCNGCRTKVERSLAKIDGVTKVEVTLNPPMAVITMEKHIPTEVLQNALSAVVADRQAQTIFYSLTKEYEKMLKPFFEILHEKKIFETI